MDRIPTHEATNLETEFLTLFSISDIWKQCFKQDDDLKDLGIIVRNHWRIQLTLLL